MKKLFVTLVLIAAVAVNANAQFRVDAGLNIGSYTFKDGLESYDLEMGIGPKASLYYDFYFIDNFGLETGLSYAQVNASNERNNGTITVSNLFIPVRAFYDFHFGKFTLTPQIGIYAGYGIGGKTKVDGGANDPFSGEGALKRFNFGAEDEILFTFGDHFTLGLGSQESVINLCEDKEVKTSSSSLYITVGWKF